MAVRTAVGDYPVRLGCHQCFGMDRVDLLLSSNGAQRLGCHHGFLKSPANRSIRQIPLRAWRKRDAGLVCLIRLPIRCRVALRMWCANLCQQIPQCQMWSVIPLPSVALYATILCIRQCKGHGLRDHMRNYSARSALAGSIDAARRAGMMLARNAQALSAPIDAASTIGSHPFTW